MIKIEDIRSLETISEETIKIKAIEIIKNTRTSPEKNGRANSKYQACPK